ncbi:flagellar hook-associated protein FlgK [Thalassobacillus sp. CUG 92003]|uniref:flagellar hook-associated protein FlgK n=1 Tax=Thalassobacillus sp. CUG 92003 TaxID=2736641 RepID=UPI0015E72F15|nr:flagellar hook-associated protein FlgK [Thalassobacillus sp. CUG 92003]
MVSTFHGLEVAKRGLFTQQSALYTTSHNIANANTPGYTRQRVNFEQTSPFPAAARNSPEIPGQMGSGVQAGSIERIREDFLDIQYRSENKKSGYYGTLADSLKQMEDVMNEPTDQGLSKSMDNFWDSWQKLSNNPEDAGAREVVKERGKALADTFNYVSNSLSEVQKQLNNEVDVSVEKINSLLSDVDNLNQQIGDVEPHGQVPNDLYDERDRVLDELSSMVDIDVSYQDSKGNPSPIAMGQATVTMNDGGESYTLVEASGETKDDRLHQMSVNYAEVDGRDTKYVQSVEVAGQAEGDDAITNFSSVGKLSGLIESAGYMEDGQTGVENVKGHYPDMMSELDTMATAFAREMNEVHREGASLNEIGEDGAYTDQAINFFTPPAGGSGADVGYASSISVSDDVNEDVNNIAAAQVTEDGQAFSGNGDNAKHLADVRDEPLAMLGGETSVSGFYEGVIGSMAVKTEEAARQQNNADTLRGSVAQNRASVSSVSLDEEMTNMVKFQHAYNAAARSITAVDEMLDRVINQMGIVGR